MEKILGRLGPSYLWSRIIFIVLNRTFCPHFFIWGKAGCRCRLLALQIIFDLGAVCGLKPINLANQLNLLGLIIEDERSEVWVRPAWWDRHLELEYFFCFLVLSPQIQHECLTLSVLFLGRDGQINQLACLLLPTVWPLWPHHERVLRGFLTNFGQVRRCLIPSLLRKLTLEQAEFFKGIPCVQLLLIAMSWLDPIHDARLLLELFFNFWQHWNVLLDVESRSISRFDKIIPLSFIQDGEWTLRFTVRLVLFRKSLLDLGNFNLNVGRTDRDPLELLVLVPTNSLSVDQSTRYTLLHTCDVTRDGWVSLAAIHQHL